MDSNNQQPIPQQGIDYLNSISAEPKVKTVNPLLLWGLIAAALVAVVMVVIGMASGGNGATNRLALVGASAANLKNLSETANNDIQNSELRSINSSLKLALANANRDLSEPLKKQKINLKNVKKDKTVAAVTAQYDEVNQRLEDARLNGLYDRTYVREVKYLLKTMHADMEQLYNSSKSKSLKSALEANDNNLAPLLESLEGFQSD